MPDEIPGATPGAGTPETPAIPAQPGSAAGGSRPKTLSELQRETAKSLSALSGDREAGSAPNNDSQNGTSGEEGAEPGSEVLSQVEDAAGQDTPEGDGADGSGTEGEGEGDTDGRWPKAAVDRLQRRTAQRDKLKAKVAELESQLAEAKKPSDPKDGQDGQQPAAVPGVDPKDPLSALNDPNEIAEASRSASRTAAYVNDLLDQLHDDPDGVATALEKAGIKLDEYTVPAMRAKLREFRLDATKVIESAPKRLQYLRDESFAISKATELMPELAKPDSERAKSVQEVLRQYPQLRQRPDWAYHATVYALGWELAQKAGTKPTPEVKPKEALPAPPKLPGVGNAAKPAPTSQKARIDALRQRAFAPGSTEKDRVAFTKACLDSQN